MAVKSNCVRLSCFSGLLFFATSVGDAACVEIGNDVGVVVSLQTNNGSVHLQLDRQCCLHGCTIVAIVKSSIGGGVRHPPVTTYNRDLFLG